MQILHGTGHGNRNGGHTLFRYGRASTRSPSIQLIQQRVLLTQLRHYGKRWWSDAHAQESHYVDMLHILRAHSIHGEASMVGTLRSSASRQKFSTSCSVSSIT